MDETMKNDVFEYLEELRASGDTNMYGATPYLEAIFDFDEKTAREWLQAWMDSYKS